VESTRLDRFLLILAAGHLVSALTGLSGMMLNMAGAARRELQSLLVAAALALIASPVVGSVFGAEGLAWLFSAALAAKSLISYGFARQLVRA
jgi:O-antigen/teichoic acid export membrane protein